MAGPRTWLSGQANAGCALQGWSRLAGFGAHDDRALAFCFGLHDRLGLIRAPLHDTAFVLPLCNIDVPCILRTGQDCTFFGMDVDLIRGILELADTRDTFTLVEVNFHAVA